LDVCFGASGKRLVGLSNSSDSAYGIATQTDDKIVVVGQAGVPGQAFGVTRFMLNGALDNTFGTAGKVISDIATGDNQARAVAVQANGKIVVAGYAQTGSDKDFAVLRYDSTGTLDPSFDGDGIARLDLGSIADQANAVVIQPSDGKIVVGGVSNGVASGIDFALIRLNTDGTIDNTFDGDGIVKTSLAASTATDEVNGLALLSDERIVAAGSAGFDFGVAVYNPNGSLDLGFDTDGKVITPIGTGTADEGLGVSVQPGNTIVVAGSNGNDFALARYLTNGALDTSFDTDGKVTTDFGGSGNQARAVQVQTDGKIVAAGSTSTAGDFALARYNSDGSLDLGFDTDGKVTTAIGINQNINGMVIQPSGKVAVAGRSTVSSKISWAVARYNP
jgi:uncharacterized delta-60 repeat protein